MSFSYIDSHCHLDFSPFIGDITDSLKKASDVGIQHIIVPAVTSDRFNAITKLSKQHAMIHAALGLHPLYITQHNFESLIILEDYLKNNTNRIIAIGEIGLDLHMETPHLEKQLLFLQQQFALAASYQLPVILHSRKTHDFLAKTLRQVTLPYGGVVHGFSGSLSQAQAFIDTGCLIGVGATITYERAQKTRNVIAKLPLEKLLLETDAPDMPISGFQGHPNRPERIVHVFQTLCQLRNEEPQLIADVLLQNTRHLFQL